MQLLSKHRIEVREFIYTSEEERTQHVDQMNKYGWIESFEKWHLKNGVELSQTKEQEIQPYARFQRKRDLDA